MARKPARKAAAVAVWTFFVRVLHAIPAMTWGVARTTAVNALFIAIAALVAALGRLALLDVVARTAAIEAGFIGILLPVTTVTWPGADTAAVHAFFTDAHTPIFTTARARTGSADPATVFASFSSISFPITARRSWVAGRSQFAMRARVPARPTTWREATQEARAKNISAQVRT